MEMFRKESQGMKLSFSRAGLAERSVGSWMYLFDVQGRRLNMILYEYDIL